MGQPLRHRRARPRHARPRAPRRTGLAPGGRDLGGDRVRRGSRDRPAGRLLPRNRGRAADAARGHDVRAAGARARDRDRRPAGADPHERDDRDRDRDHAGVRACGARCRARGDGLSLHRVRPGARRIGVPDHAPPPAAEHRRAADRARHDLSRDGDPQRGRAQLPRARHPAA